jgi:DNA-binding transcriptional LysR family regulator
MMNFTWLADFLALADSGNFSRAAEERHMTQPAFSRRVRALEEWLGADLFDRSTQPARLTPAGEWFREVAGRLVNDVERLPGQVQAVAQASSSTLCFAATHALSFTFMPGWLRGLESHTSVGPVQLVSDVMARCESLLAHNKVHFVLCHAHPSITGHLDSDQALWLTVGADALVPVSAPGEAGRALHALDVERPAGLPLLTYSAESGLGRVFRAVLGRPLEQQGALPVFTAHLASVLRTMALDGRGLAWLPQSLVADDLRAGRLVPAGDERWRIALDIRLYRSASAQGRAAEDFWRAAALGGNAPV